MPAGKKSVQKVVLGLYSHGGTVEITGFTKKCPWTTKLLTAFVQKAHPQFFFTSLQVNVNNKCAPHTDRNLSTSFIYGLGNYTGGELFVEDPNGADRLLLSKAVSGYPKGAEVRGDYLNIKSKWLEFDGGKVHAVKPFKGIRFSLVYYTCPEYAQASPRVRMACCESGFKYPLLQQLDDRSRDATATSAASTGAVPKAKTGASKRDRRRPRGLADSDSIQKAVKKTYALLKAKTGSPGPRKRGRPRKDVTTDGLADSDGIQKAVKKTYALLKAKTGSPGPRKRGRPRKDVTTDGLADSDGIQKAVKKTYALLKVNSNQKGGGGTANFRKALSALRSAVNKLPGELELQILTLLDKAEDKENFEAKTSGTWRRFLPSILELLGVTGPELEQAKKDANPRDLSMEPVKKAMRLARKRLAAADGRNKGSPESKRRRCDEALSREKLK